MEGGSRQCVWRQKENELQCHSERAQVQEGPRVLVVLVSAFSPCTSVPRCACTSNTRIRRGDWFDECFIQEVAKKLPTKHFTCTNMPDLEDDVTIQEEVLMTVAEDNVDKKGPKGPKCKDMKTAATCEDTECS
eukprot:1460673-Rhodomonas_salina.1